MIINDNISSLNTLNKLSANTKSAQSALAKLSSGLKINSAADDAAGLAISQKMQAQINGLDQSSTNAQDGISLVQTADGSLNETESILQRMNTLAVEAASDTETDSDRTAIQSEVSQLTTEINRIGTTTNYNTKNLLDGSSGVSVASSTNNITNLSGTADTKAATIALVSTDITLATAGTVTATSPGGESNSSTNLANASTIGIAGKSYSFTASNTVNDVLTAINADSGSTGVSASWTVAGGFKLTATKLGSGSNVDVTTTGTGEFTGMAKATTAGTDVVLDAAAQTAIGGSYKASGSTITVTGGNEKGLQFDAVGVTADTNITVGTNNSLTLQIGAAAGQTMSVSIGDMRASALGISGIDMSSQANASSAITTISAALSKVLTQRATLGAYENRLDHTINNLSTESENLTSAKSNITDVDMAKEMTEYTKENILVQSSEAMLAQANQLPQGVLSLLK